MPSIKDNELNFIITCVEAAVNYWARRFGLTAQDREDVFQDIFEKILKPSTRVPVGSGLKPWTFRVAYNHLVSRCRYEARRPNCSLDALQDKCDEAWEVDIARWPGLGSGCKEMVMKLDVELAIERLGQDLGRPELVKTLVWLYAAEGLSFRDIEQFLELKRNQLNVLYNEVKEKIEHEYPELSVWLDAA